MNRNRLFSRLAAFAALIGVAALCAAVPRTVPAPSSAPASVSPSQRIAPASPAVLTQTPDPLPADISLEDMLSLLDESARRYAQYDCGDGGFVVEANLWDDDRFFRAAPQFREDGLPCFFNGLIPGGELEAVREGEELVTQLPLKIMDTEGFRMAFAVRWTAQDGVWAPAERNFVFLNEEDRDFDARYSAMDYDEREIYRESLEPPWEGQSLIDNLRLSAYCGNSQALAHLAMLAGEGRDGLDGNLLELAASRVWYSNATGEGNPYLPKIIYDNSCKKFPAAEALRQAARAVRTGTVWAFRDMLEIESNLTTERFLEVPNIFDYATDKSDVEDWFSNNWGAYELDFDGDGLDEFVLFTGGGTMGNEFWDIVQLDGQGNMTERVSGMHMRSFAMREIDGHYFFTNWEYDYCDKESIGLNLFAMDRGGVMWEGRARLENTGAEIVFSDCYDEGLTELYDTLSPRLADYVKIYKQYEYTGFAPAADLDEAVKERLVKDAWGGLGEFGLADVDNDGLEDTLYEYLYLPGSAHLGYGYWLSARLSCGGNIVKLHKLGGEEDAQRVFVVGHGGKNYLLTMEIFGDSQYIFKLSELTGGVPRTLASWILSMTGRVVVDAGKYIDEGYGLDW